MGLLATQWLSLSPSRCFPCCLTLTGRNGRWYARSCVCACDFVDDNRNGEWQTNINDNNNNNFYGYTKMPKTRIVTYCWLVLELKPKNGRLHRMVYVFACSNNKLIPKCIQICTLVHSRLMHWIQCFLFFFLCEFVFTVIASNYFYPSDTRKWFEHVWVYFRTMEAGIENGNSLSLWWQRQWCRDNNNDDNADDDVYIAAISTRLMGASHFQKYCIETFNGIERKTYVEKCEARKMANTLRVHIMQYSLECFVWFPFILSSSLFFDSGVSYSLTTKSRDHAVPKL